MTVEKNYSPFAPPRPSARWGSVTKVTPTRSFIIEDSRGVAQPGSAPALGAGGPRFKSARPDQSFIPGGHIARRGTWKAWLMNILISILIRIVEVMFVAGVIGSAIVVVLTSVEDFKMLFEKETSPGGK